MIEQKQSEKPLQFTITARRKEKIRQYLDYLTATAPPFEEFFQEEKQCEVLPAQSNTLVE